MHNLKICNKTRIFNFYFISFYFEDFIVIAYQKQIGEGVFRFLFLFYTNDFKGFYVVCAF